MDSKLRSFLLVSTLSHYVVGLLKSVEELNGKLVRSYRLNISASDHGTPVRTSYQQLTINIVDQNNNPPTFSQAVYEASLPEDTRVGTKVIKVQAYPPNSNIGKQILILGRCSEHFS